MSGWDSRNQKPKTATCTTESRGKQKSKMWILTGITRSVYSSLQNEIKKGFLQLPKTSTTSTAGLKNFQPPPDYSDIELPERPKLKFVDKVPQYPPTIRPPKMQRRLDLIRGPEPIHNQLTLKQYGIQALCGGLLHHGHFEMLRMGIQRRMDASKMFAIWRIDPPWKPRTKKGQGKRMGGGKGSIDHYVTPVKAGRIIIEVGGRCEFAEVKGFLKELADKLPFKAKPVSQELLEQEAEEEKMLKEQNLNPYNTEYVILNNMGGCHSWISPYDKKWFWKHV